MHVAEPVRLVYHNEIPRNDHEFVGIARGELKRADDEILLLERAACAILFEFVIIASLQDCRREEKFLCELLRPLLPKVRRRDDKNAAFALRPFLGEHEAGFNGLSQSYLVGQDGGLRKRRLERKKSRLDLVGIEIDLRIQQCAGKLRGVSYRSLPGQLVSKELCVIFSRQFAASWIAISSPLSCLVKRACGCAPLPDGHSLRQV
jgi:hypothetical protein